MLKITIDEHAGFPTDNFDDEGAEFKTYRYSGYQSANASGDLFWYNNNFGGSINADFSGEHDVDGAEDTLAIFATVETFGAFSVSQVIPTAC